MEKQDADGGHADERDDGPGLPQRNRDEGQRCRGDHGGERCVAEEREDGDPDHGRGQPDERREREEGAAARRDHLPAALEAQEQRPPVPEHRCAARQCARERARDLGGDEGGHEPLREVEHDHGSTEAGAEAPRDVRGADVAAPEAADIAALEDPDEPVAEREAAGQVAGQDEECGFYLSVISYFATQSFTVAQSRLFMKASMYDARSVWKSMKYACS